jgi:hypothetical protein
MDSSLPAKLTSSSLAISVCITVKLKPMSRKANRRLLLANLSPVDFMESSSKNSGLAGFTDQVDWTDSFNPFIRCHITPYLFYYEGDRL